MNKIIKGYENQYCIKFIDSLFGKSVCPFKFLQFASKRYTLNYITDNNIW